MKSVYKYTTNIGDRVVAKQNDESAQWCDPKVPNNTEGTVVGRYRYIRHRANFGLDTYFYAPGIYEQNGAIQVLWDGQTEPMSMSESDMCLLDQDEASRRQDEWCALTQDQRDAIIKKVDDVVRIGDLPNTKFSELDIVRIISHHGKPAETVEIGMITSIKYDDPHSKFAYGIQRLSEDGEETSGSYYAISEEDLELTAHGNLWNEMNGKPLIFANINEEASYAKQRGRAKEVRNPANGLYSWTLDELLDAIENGIVDAFNVSHLFGVAPHHNGYKFDDADLGKRLREETLKGFGRK